MTSFIMAGALTMGQPIENIMPPQDAPRYIAKALYKEMALDRVVSKWEDKYLKLDEHPELAYIGVIARIGIEQRVTYEWRF